MLFLILFVLFCLMSRSPQVNYRKILIELFHPQIKSFSIMKSTSNKKFWGQCGKKKALMNNYKIPYLSSFQTSQGKIFSAFSRKRTKISLILNSFFWSSGTHKLIKQFGLVNEDALKIKKLNEYAHVNSFIKFGQYLGHLDFVYIRQRSEERPTWFKYTMETSCLLSVSTVALKNLYFLVVREII